MSNVLLDVKDHIATITISRPKALNALNMDVIYELEKVLDDLKDNKDVRCVILTGDGDRAFVAGADTKQLEILDVEGGHTLSHDGNRVFSKIEHFPTPVIAAVNGFALGGGCEIAMSCDIRIASDNAIFGLPETSLGIYPGWGGTQRMSRLIGYAMAAELLFSGERIKAEEAKRVGLVNHVYSQDDLMNEARKLAGKIAANAPIGVQSAKKSMKAGLDVTLSEALKIESEGFSKLFDTVDAKKGLHAFNNREEYSYQGK